MKTHKVHMNNDPSKTFKNICFWEKKIYKKKQLQLIWTCENMVKVFKEKIHDISFSFLFHHILSPNNKFGM